MLWLYMGEDMNSLASFGTSETLLFAIIFRSGAIPFARIAHELCSPT
jgi:hypothetical protein